MRRFHLFEFLDQTWYPHAFRCIQTDYLQFSQYAATRFVGMETLLPVFRKGLSRSGTATIVDLCSGGTGSWIRLKRDLLRAGLKVRVRLTDKYPNPASLEKWPEELRQGIEYVRESVDALNVPDHLKGMRTLFAGFHHFRPEQARQILRDASDKRTPIAVFDPSGIRSPLGLLALLLFAPLLPVFMLLSYWVMTPFIQPRTASRFLWTYLIPVVPAVTCWDGVVSFLRGYTDGELREMTASLPAKDYAWEIGRIVIGFPLTCLLGYPV
jgi:hypothetical protein